MHGTIYCLENTLADKQYIGQTVDFDRRMQQYASGHCHKGPLRNAILKYGWKHFYVTIVEEIPVEDLDEAERFWIAFLNTQAPNGYNLQSGGSNGKHSDITKAKMSKTRRKQASRGEHVSQRPEVRKKLSERAKQRGTAHLQKPEVFRKRADTQRKKGAQGKHASQRPDVKAKISTTNKQTTQKKLEDGTHHFITHNPMRSSEGIAKMRRVRRNNRPTLDWVDMLEEEG